MAPMNKTRAARAAHDERLEQRRAALGGFVASARDLEASFRSRQETLRTLTETYAAGVLAELGAHSADWKGFVRAYGPGGETDQASNSRHTPRHLGEALARMLVAAGITFDWITLRAAQQAVRASKRRG